MKQFILSNIPQGSTVRLNGDDYRYLVRVRRLAVGEYFTAGLPNGETAQVKVTSIDDGVLTGELVFKESAHEQKDVNNECKIPPIILFQALPKADKMDLIVRQAAEGGVYEIVPFVSEFSVVKTHSAAKFTRWEKIIKEARQQSGSKVATGIHHPVSMEGLLEYWRKKQEEKTGGNPKEKPLGLLFHHLPQNTCGGLEQNSLHGYLNNNPKIVVLAVGPEGGFSEKEVNLFMENGFNPITIGDTILRTETAALYCSAAIRVILLERNSWESKKMKICSG